NSEDNDIIYTRLKKDKCIYEYVWNFIANDIYNELPNTATLVKSTGENCDEITYETLCELGKDYFDQYKDLLVTQKDREYLLKISDWICKENIEDLMVAQKKLYDNYMSKAKSLTQLLNQKKFSFEGYYLALNSINNWIKKGSATLLTPENREVLFQYVYAYNTDVLEQVSIYLKIDMIRVMLNGDLTSMFDPDHHDMITKMVKSIKNEEAEIFIEALEHKDYYLNGAPLIYHLKERLSDFATNDAYSEFFKQLLHLSIARYESSGKTIDVKGNLTWEVENKDYVLVSFVKNKSDFSYSYNDETHTVNIKTCISCCSGTRACNEKGRRQFDTI